MYSTLCFAEDVVGDSAVGSGLDDGAELLLVFLDVVVEGHEEPFGMDGAHDDAFTDSGTLEAGEHLGEVEDNLGGVVADYHEVGIGAFGDLGVDVEFEVLFFLVCHNGSFL